MKISERKPCFTHYTITYVQCIKFSYQTLITNVTQVNLCTSFSWWANCLVCDFKLQINEKDKTPNSCSVCFHPRSRWTDVRVAARLEAHKASQKRNADAELQNCIFWEQTKPANRLLLMWRSRRDYQSGRFRFTTGASSEIGYKQQVREATQSYESNERERVVGWFVVTFLGIVKTSVCKTPLKKHNFYILLPLLKHHHPDQETQVTFWGDTDEQRCFN